MNGVGRYEQRPTYLNNGVFLPKPQKQEISPRHVEDRMFTAKGSGATLDVVPLAVAEAHTRGIDRDRDRVAVDDKISEPGPSCRPVGDAQHIFAG